MTHSKDHCHICSRIDPVLSNVDNADLIGTSESTIRRHRKAAHPYLKMNGASVYEDGVWYKYSTVEGAGPKWPVVQPAQPVKVSVRSLPSKSKRSKYRTALFCGDNQIGFRVFDDGTHEEFHDTRAHDLLVEIARREQPDDIIILGDFLDLPSQGRWAQEAAFAKTTQMSLDYGHEWLARLRAVAPKAKIVLVEGNHDKRLSTYVENNAVAAFGLRKAGKPESWPVMSLPYLLRLDELNVEYMDAYPAATYWVTDNIRCIHGTRSNARGSTTAQYASELPHISTLLGHSHRAEVTWKTVLGPRGEAIRSFVANPGTLCKTDGTVPGFHSAQHVDGTSAKIVEDWQQGWGILLYNDDEAWPSVTPIVEGKTFYNGEVISA